MRVAALIVGVVIAAALLWNAGEWHYRNCIAAARATQTYGFDWNDTIGKHIRGCSRLPF